MKRYTHDYSKPSAAESVLYSATRLMANESYDAALERINEARTILQQYLAQDNMIQDEEVEGCYVRYQDITDFDQFHSGYNEGFFVAAEAVASLAIRLINNHPSWMLDPSLKQAIVDIKFATKHILRKRGLIPTTYDVIMRKAEDVPVDFNLQY